MARTRIFKKYYTKDHSIITMHKACIRNFQAMLLMEHFIMHKYQVLSTNRKKIMQELQTVMDSRKV